MGPKLSVGALDDVLENLALSAGHAWMLLAP
jgi:hypothetical protein